MRKLVKYDFNKCYDINSMPIHGILNPCNCNNKLINNLNNFDFAVYHYAVIIFSSLLAPPSPIILQTSHFEIDSVAIDSHKIETYSFSQ